MTETGGGALTSEELRTLEAIVSRLGGRGADLPLPLFRFVVELAAIANVDLLVRDDEAGVLLAWREDSLGSGWHVPGGIIRHREEVAHRLSACAREEFGCEVEVADRPIALIEIFDDRGHFVSLVYPTVLRGTPSRRIVGEGDEPQPGDLCWFPSPPESLYPSHLVYRDVLEALARPAPGEGVRLFTHHVGRRGADRTAPEGSIDPRSPLT